MYRFTIKVIKNLLTHIETVLKEDMHVIQKKVKRNHLNMNNKNDKMNGEWTKCGDYLPSDIQMNCTFCQQIKFHQNYLCEVYQLIALLETP